MIEIPDRYKTQRSEVRAMTALLDRYAHQLPDTESVRTPTALVSVLGPADPDGTPLLGPADTPAAAPIMGASRVNASVPVMGRLAPATIPVLGPADSPAAAPVMSATR
jgi:hypothetical protein